MLRREHDPFPRAKKTLRIAQFFTGGLDSTYLLYKNLKAGHSVTPHYVEVVNNVNKSKIEKQQLVKIHAVLHKEFPGQLNDPKMISKVDIWKGWDNGLKFSQVPIWLFATNYVDQDYYDEIQMGYVSNDDAVPFIEDMKNLYKAMDWLMYEHYNRPALTFPLLKDNKFEMLRVLPYNLKELIYSCENPNVSDEFQSHTEESLAWYGNRYGLFLDHKDKFYIFEPCGVCDSCKKIMNSEYLFDNYSGAQPVYKKIKVNQTINAYNELMDRTRYNDELKELVAEKDRKDNRIDNEYWKSVEHPSDSNEVLITAEQQYKPEPETEISEFAKRVNKAMEKVSKGFPNLENEINTYNAILDKDKGCTDQSRDSMANGMVR